MSEVRVKMPEDQRQFLAAYLEPSSLVSTVAFGGSRYTGKTFTAAFGTVLRRAMYSNTRAICLRQHQREADLNIGEEVRAVCRMLKWPVSSRNENYIKYIAGDNRFNFPNGSLIQVLYCMSDEDWKPHVGLQWDDIWFEQLEQLYDGERIFDAFAGSNRPNNPSCPARRVLTFNPPIPDWVQERIVSPKTRDRRTVYVPASIRRCQATLERDPGYMLRSLISIKDPVLRAQWLDGDYDARSDLFFKLKPDTDAEAGTIQTLEPPYWSDWYCGLDWGRKDEFACLWGAKWKDDDVEVMGRVVRYGKPHMHICGEVYQSGLELDQQARRVLEFDKEMARRFTNFQPPSIRMAGWDTAIGREKESTEQSITKAQIWRKHGLVTYPSPQHSRSSYWELIKYLIDKRILTIDPCCKALIKEFKSAIVLPHKDDIDQRRSKDHALDALAYMICYLFGLTYRFREEPAYAKLSA